MTSARHTTKQIERIDQEIIRALTGERWLNAKQIRHKLEDARIYTTGQFVSKRCNVLEETGTIERLDYNSGKSGGRRCWRLAA